ncbi:glycosyltransferase [Enterovibrio norvegicus]|uniref:Glycosyltransferase 2-like domain-containing protein n=1 Tax=Enterovibrio norvegicus TaxID=188144 RepID=A0A2N7LDQ1_9GAMM|nr:glycosyltransferase [Enterovibrio norvegicus]PML75582.1 hypothetical protein BCT69_06385 [Enterovibrio norvegicus]PMN93496.1 hypothetical protein BCT23_12620 [Enterovibrio norvegicus]
MKVSVGLVTFNRKEHLVRCLEGIYNQSIPVGKVYCIDNNSKDGTSELLLEYGYFEKDNFIYINTKENLGGAGGFRYAVKHILENDDSDKIWLMDDDVMPHQKCLEGLLLQSDKCTITQPSRRYLQDNSFVSSDSKNININNHFQQLHSNPICENEAKSEKIIDSESFPFEGPMFDRDMVEKIGLPDDKFFILYDDTDYAIRAIKSGYKIKYVSDAILYRQIKPIVVNKEVTWKTYFSIRNSIYIEKKHCSFTVFIIRTLRRFLGCLINIFNSERKYKTTKLTLLAFCDALFGDMNNDLKRVNRILK